MRGETIVCISSRSWESLWRHTQPLIVRMARDNRVLFFEPGRNPDKPWRSELPRNLVNFCGVYQRPLHTNLIRIQLPSKLPYMKRQIPRVALPVGIAAISRLNAEIVVRHVRRALRELAVEAPILWLDVPMPWVAGRCGEALSVYFNYDEHAEFAGNQQIEGMLRALDERVCAEVDLVFATSRGQAERRRRVNPHTYMVPNGVDFELFHTALSGTLPLPPDIASIPGPIIGFAGWLGHQVDVALLYRVAEAFPHCSLVLVGPDELPQSAARSGLARLPNVYFLGQKRREDLPAYLQRFDVGLIPYLVDTGHMRTGYPLKLQEYLAAGRATVGTAMLELYQYADVVRIGEDHAQFVEQVAAALADQSAAAVAARVAVARQNTWDQRVEAIYQALDTFLHMASEPKKGGRVALLREAKASDLLPPLL